MNKARSVLALLGVALAAYGQRYYTYVGNLTSDSVLLAWGTADGVNTIGRSSPSHGNATVRIAGKTIDSRQNWVVVGNLKPDTVYPYEVLLDGRQIAQSVVQTWAEHDNKLVFFVIGDYGNGSRDAIRRRPRDGGGVPAPQRLRQPGAVRPDDRRQHLRRSVELHIGFRGTGARDADWQRKFFEPYKDVLAHVPFYPSLGNHDGNETENREDLAAYLDNFFFPGRQACALVHLLLRRTRRLLRARHHHEHGIGSGLAAVCPDPARVEVDAAGVCFLHGLSGKSRTSITRPSTPALAMPRLTGTSSTGSTCSANME